MGNILHLWPIGSRLGYWHWMNVHFDGSILSPAHLVHVFIKSRSFKRSYFARGQTFVNGKEGCICKKTEDKSFRIANFSFFIFLCKFLRLVVFLLNLDYLIFYVFPSKWLLDVNASTLEKMKWETHWNLWKTWLNTDILSHNFWVKICPKNLLPRHFYFAVLFHSNRKISKKQLFIL